MEICIVVTYVFAVLRLSSIGRTKFIWTALKRPRVNRDIDRFRLALSCGQTHGQLNMKRIIYYTTSSTNAVIAEIPKRRRSSPVL